MLGFSFLKTDTLFVPALAISIILHRNPKKYPDVSFNIYTAIADDVKECLENGILDMGLLLEPVEVS